MRCPVHVCADAQSLAREVSGFVVAEIKRRLLELNGAGMVEVAVAGGFISTAILPGLLKYSQVLDWSRVRFWWVDERFVSAGDSDRNDEAVITSVLRYLPGVSWVSFPTDEGQGLESALECFTDLWTAEMGARSLDLALLGMGPDGHIASLFPKDEWVTLGLDSPAVLAVDDSPKPPRMRLSLSMPVICSAKQIVLATGGSSKREALAEVCGGGDPALWPAATLLADEVVARTEIFIDADAVPQGASW